MRMYSLINLLTSGKEFLCLETWPGPSAVNGHTSRPQFLHMQAHISSVLISLNAIRDMTWTVLFSSDLAHNNTMSALSARSKCHQTSAPFRPQSPRALHTPSPLNVSHSYNDHHPMISMNDHRQVNVGMLCTGGIRVLHERNKSCGEKKKCRID